MQAEGSLIPESMSSLAFPIKDLRPYPRNPNNGDEEGIRESLRENGQFRPVVVNEGSAPDWSGQPNTVLAGNHTYAAMLAEGAEEIAVTWVDVGDERAAKIVIADNRYGKRAWTDEAIAAELLGEIEDLAGTGYSTREYDDLIASLDSRGASSILDRFGEPSGAGADDLTGAGQTREQTRREETSGDKFYTLSYAVTPEQREVVREALAKAKASGASNSIEALVVVCREYAASTGDRAA